MPDKFFNSLFDFLSKPISLGILVAFFYDISHTTDRAYVFISRNH